MATNARRVSSAIATRILSKEDELSRFKQQLSPMFRRQQSYHTHQNVSYWRQRMEYPWSQKTPPRKTSLPNTRVVHTPLDNYGSRRPQGRCKATAAAPLCNRIVLNGSSNAFQKLKNRFRLWASYAAALVVVLAPPRRGRLNNNVCPFLCTRSVHRHAPLTSMLSSATSRCSWEFLTC